MSLNPSLFKVIRLCIQDPTFYPVKSLKLHTLAFLEIPKNRLFSGVPLVLQVMIPGMGIVVYH